MKADGRMDRGGSARSALGKWRTGRHVTDRHHGVPGCRASVSPSRYVWPLVFGRLLLLLRPHSRLALALTLAWCA